ncbi:MAG: NAD-dependent epimerase/dehydratase family protein [Thermoanaerobaculia bacterium]
MNILLTGGTGFVGTALQAELKKRGIPYELSFQRVDLTTDWSEALEGHDMVLHLAGVAHVFGKEATEELFRKVNVEGTLRLARACVEKGVKRFIFLSSVKVNGDESGPEPYREDTPPRPEDAYGRSKAEAERLLREMPGLDVTIVRTPLVYGPGVKANFLALMRAVDRNRPLPFGLIRNQRSLIFVGNLVDALLLVASREEAIGQTYYVSDGEDVSTPELVQRIGRALGKSALALPVPLALLRLLGMLTGKSGAIRRPLGSLRVDSTKIRRELGWTPPHTMDEGMRATAEWYQRSA